MFGTPVFFIVILHGKTRVFCKSKAKHTGKTRISDDSGFILGSYIIGLIWTCIVDVFAQVRNQGCSGLDKLGHVVFDDGKRA